VKRPTISDVAEKAGVSKATVSHVINETRFVEEETRQRVLEAVAALRYRPSTVARSLTTKRTGVIGVLISDAANHFFGEVLRGIDEVLRPTDHALIVCNTDEILKREAHFLDLLLRQRVDGIIAAATSQKWSALDQAEVQHTPVVFLDRTFEGLSGPFVGVDNAAGAQMGVEHLIECGHRHIGIIAGFQRLSTVRERLAGFRQCLREQGIPLPEEWVVPCALSVEAGREATMRVLSLPERPTALFLNNNLLSLGALLAIKELGLKCPDDIALIGFDDHPWAAVSCPPLTVVRQPAKQIGQIAAEMLSSLIAGEQPSEAQIIMDCKLVLRESCCPSHEPQAPFGVRPDKGQNQLSQQIDHPVQLGEEDL
jgi:LacI family transcriptional regulator